MHVKLSLQFKEDLNSVIDYLLQKSTLQKARGLRDAVLQKIQWIENHPERGRDLEGPFRAAEIPGTRFRIIYSIEPDSIDVHVLEDTRREPGYWRDLVK